jgi:hypothetical protein
VPIPRYNLLGLVQVRDSVKIYKRQAKRKTCDLDRVHFKTDPNSLFDKLTVIRTKQKFAEVSTFIKIK